MTIVLCSFFRVHIGEDLVRADLRADGSLLKQLWHHHDAIMCCSVVENVSHDCFLLILYYSDYAYLMIFVQLSGICSFYVRQPSWPWHDGDDTGVSSGHNARKDSLDSRLRFLQHHAARIIYTQYYELKSFLVDPKKLALFYFVLKSQLNKLPSPDQDYWWVLLVVNCRGLRICQLGRAFRAWGERSPLRGRLLTRVDLITV